MRVTTLLFAASAVLGSAASAEARPHPFVAGEPLPELTLPAAENGQPRSLSELRGRKMVLHVFASW